MALKQPLKADTPMEVTDPGTDARIKLAVIV